MTRWLQLSLLSVGLVLVAGCGAATDEPTPEETTLTVVGQAAPPFQLTTLDGAEFDLAALRGEVVVVNFFATWCAPCKEEMPHLEKEVWQRFRGDGLHLLAVGREHSNDELGEFRDTFELTFPVAGDPDRAVFSLYAQQYIPRTVVIARDGTIAFQSSGFAKDEFADMIATIERELAVNAPAATSDEETETAA